MSDLPEHPSGSFGSPFALSKAPDPHLQDQYQHLSRVHTSSDSQRQQPSFGVNFDTIRQPTHPLPDWRTHSPSAPSGGHLQSPPGSFAPVAPAWIQQMTALAAAQQQQSFSPVPLPPLSQGVMDLSSFNAHQMAGYNVSQQGGHHNTLAFSPYPYQQMQQASGSTQLPSSSGQQLSGSGVTSSTAEGSSDQHDAAPKASHRSKKQPAAAANAPAGKRAKGKKGKEQTAEIVDLSDVPEEKHRAADWTVKETVWLLRGLLQVWGAWYKRTGSAKQGTKSDAQKFENDLPLILNQCGLEAGYPAGTPFPRPATSLHPRYKNLVSELKDLLYLESYDRTSGETEVYLKTDDAGKWDMLERAGVYSRHTAKGNTRQTPKQYLGGSLEVYELLLELKKDDQDINPAAVAAVGVKRFQVKKQSDKTDSTEDRDVTHDKPRSQKEKANTAGGGEEVYSDATSSDNGNSSGNDVTSPVKKAVQEAGGRLKKGKPAAIDIAAELQQAKQMAANMEKGMEKMEQWRLEDKQRQDERDAQQQAREDKRDADSKALMGQLFSILDKFK